MAPVVADTDPNPLISLFRQCVVRISDGAGTLLGTGFFVAPGQVITCAHVVHGAAAIQVSWQGQLASAAVTGAVPPLDTVADPGAYPLPDLALLSLRNETQDWNHPCVRLMTGHPALDRAPEVLYLAGYTIEHAGTTALTGTTTEFESVICEDEHTFYKLKRGQVLPGFSGSPLLNLRTGSVAGIAESSRGRHADLGGFAVPAAALAAAFPQVAEANQAFHGRDTRWMDALEAEKTRAAERAGARPRLPLRPSTVPLVLDEDVSPAVMLRPRHAVVDYVGRHQLLADLATWCEREAANSQTTQLWFVTGGGGFGKTRLAVQACTEAEARGWTAGLLPPDPGEGELEALAEWPGRLLITVDYAETRPGLAGRLVEKLARHAPRPPARILLLVRRRASRADLLAMFNEEQEEHLAALLRQAPLSRLDEAATEIDRLALFDRAISDFSTLLGAPPAQPSRPRLRAAHFDRPLYVLTAALLKQASPGTDVDKLSEADLLRTLLSEHEARYWDRWDKRRQLALDPADQRAAVAIATLLTADTDTDALTVARLIPHHAEEPQSRLIAIARWLAQLYPPAATRPGQLVIAPLEPDRLGEVLVGDLLRRHPGLLAAAINAASDRQLTQALTITGRIARDDPAVRAQLRAVLDQRLADLLQRAFAAGSHDLLIAVGDTMTITRPTQGALAAADRFPTSCPSGCAPSPQPSPAWPSMDSARAPQASQTQPLN